MAILSHLMTLVPTMGFRMYRKFSRSDALRDIHACNPDYLVPSEQASDLFVNDVAFRRGYGDAKSLRSLRRTSLMTKITIMTLVLTMGFRTLYQQLLLLTEN
jgi:hypothetical protein